MMIAARLMSLAGRTRHWFERQARSAEACVGCGVTEREGPRRIAGPGLTICEHCVQEASSALEGWRPGEVRALGAGVTARGCAFCGKPRADALGLVGWPAGAICGKCIMLCEELLRGERGAPDEVPSNDR